MIGPKRFDNKEKLRIAMESSVLEKMLEDTVPKASALCEERDERTEEYEMKLEEYLYSIGARDKVKICIDEQQFSEFSPDVRYKALLGVDAADEERSKGLEINSILSSDQIKHIRKMGGKYQIEMADFNERFGKLYVEQEDLYDSIVEKTMVETLFKQDSVKDRVILYFFDPTFERLRRAAIDLSTGKTYEELQISDIDAKLHPGFWNVRKLKKEARDSDANVYLVSNAWNHMLAEEMLMHVKKELQAQYDELHPALANAREKRLAAKELNRNLEIAATKKQDAQRDSTYFVREDGHGFGWVHPDQDVSSDVLDDLTKLMDIEQRYEN
jgi:hypothetical protein